MKICLIVGTSWSDEGKTSMKSLIAKDYYGKIKYQNGYKMCTVNYDSNRGHNE